METSLRNNNDLVIRNPSCLLKHCVVVAVVAAGLNCLTAAESIAGQHGVPGASVAGCLDGQCPEPIGPFGYHRPSWRPWPNRKSAALPGRRGTGADPGVAPMVPAPTEESRIRARTRSDRPLDPEYTGTDLGTGTSFGSDSNLGSGLVPTVPDPTESPNIFGSSTDLPPVPSNNVPAGNGAPMFSPAPDQNDDAPGLFDDPPPMTPSGNDDSGDGLDDIFGQSGLFPEFMAKSEEPKALLAHRSIQARGISLLASNRVAGGVRGFQAAAKSKRAKAVERESKDSAVKPASFSTELDDANLSLGEPEVQPNIGQLSTQQLTDSMQLPELPAQIGELPARIDELLAPPQNLEESDSLVSQPAETTTSIASPAQQETASASSASSDELELEQAVSQELASESMGSPTSTTSPPVAEPRSRNPLRPHARLMPSGSATANSDMEPTDRVEETMPQPNLLTSQPVQRSLDEEIETVHSAVAVSTPPLLEDANSELQIDTQPFENRSNSRNLNRAVASRSIRDTLRRNPLRQ